MQRRGLLIGIIVLVLLLAGIVSTYNSLVTLDQAVDSQWAQVENAYQRRADLVPNLVATVKGAAEHERETFTAVTEARAKLGSLDLRGAVDDPALLQRYQAAQDQLSSALARLVAVSEAYPQLRANENFLALQAQLEGTENRISIERHRFNELASGFNTRRERFPTVMFAGLLGDRFKPKTYFTANPAAATAPQVQF